MLLTASQTEDIELIVPEVVVLEAVSVFHERVEAAAAGAQKLETELRTIGIDFSGALPDDATPESYEARLRRRLEDAGATVAHPPEVDHLDLVRRGIAKKKPFDTKGRGYRDSLIWSHVLEAAADDEVVLVSENHRDFAGEDARTLAPELADELESAGLARDQVRLVPSLRVAVTEHVEPSAQAITRMRVLLQNQAFRDQLLDVVAEALRYRELEPPEDADLRMLDVQDVQVEDVAAIEDLQIDEAYEDGDLIDFNLGGTMTATLEFYPLKYEIAGADVPEVTVHDWDWNDHVVYASKAMELAFEGFGSYNPENEELSKFDVWLVY